MKSWRKCAGKPIITGSVKLYSVLLPPPPVTNINPALRVHLLNSLWSILAGPHPATNNVRILPGTNFIHMGECSNVDKVSCWGTKVPGIDGNRTRNPLIPESRVQSNIPRYLHVKVWPYSMRIDYGMSCWVIKWKLSAWSDWLITSRSMMIPASFHSHITYISSQLDMKAVCFLSLNISRCFIEHPNIWSPVSGQWR